MPNRSPVKQASLTDLRQYIERIRSIELRTSTIDEITQLLEPVLDGWVVGVPQFAPGAMLFRARQLEAGQAPFRNLTDVSYSPPALATAQRANREHDPLFYCAAGRDALFYELRARVGTRLVLTHYKTTAILTVNRIGFTPETFARLNAQRAVPEYGRLRLDQYDNRDQLVNAFLSEVFCQQVSDSEKWRYKISIAIAERLLCSDFLQGLLYPAVPMCGNMDNFALKPDYADRHLQPEFAETLWVTRVDEASITCEKEDEARSFSGDGTINWLGRKGEWQLRNEGEELILEAINGHWVARDIAGRIIDPE